MNIGANTIDAGARINQICSVLVTAPDGVVRETSKVIKSIPLKTAAEVTATGMAAKDTVVVFV